MITEKDYLNAKQIVQEYESKHLNILDIRQRSISWWYELSDNPLLRMIKQGELTTKYYGQMRKTSSLTGREIQNIYLSEWKQ